MPFPKTLSATLAALFLLAPAIVVANDGPTLVDPAEAVASEDEQPTDEEGTTDGNAAEPEAGSTTTDEVVKKANEKAKQVAKEVDESETAKEASAGLLQAIYDLAEAMSFSAFHWVAFTIMATGVVSFALQLVLGKLVVLATGGFSLTAILADALGLVVSLVGLVLTTQAAAENSEFTQSPAAVLSATLVGVVAGFLFYLWGQRQEIEAARGRSKAR